MITRCCDALQECPGARDRQSAGVPARKVFDGNVAGLGNIYNVGLRTMVTDGKALYLGTENYSNINAQGGWELIKVYKPGTR